MVTTPIDEAMEERMLSRKSTKKPKMPDKCRFIWKMYVELKNNKIKELRMGPTKKVRLQDMSRFWMFSIRILAIVNFKIHFKKIVQLPACCSCEQWPLHWVLLRKLLIEDQDACRANWNWPKCLQQWKEMKAEMLA